MFIAVVLIAVLQFIIYIIASDFPADKRAFERKAAKRRQYKKQVCYFKIYNTYMYTSIYVITRMYLFI